MMSSRSACILYLQIDVLKYYMSHVILQNSVFYNSDMQN